ncbi:MAG: hypothetical protein ACXVA9_13515, partial [Bdellovibrionales bacterium]
PWFAWPINFRVLTSLLLLVLFARADEFGQQLCSLKGEIVLSAPTQIICMKDMKIADGTRIITQGNPLSITAVGNINFGEPPAKGERPPKYPGARIFSFKAPAPQSRAGGPIYIYGNTAFGNLEIRNRGASEKDLSGEVAIEYVTRGKSYSQSVDVAPGTHVELIVNGYALKPSGTAKAAPGSEAESGAASVAAAPSTEKHPPKIHKKRIRKVRRPQEFQQPPQFPSFWHW